MPQGTTSRVPDRGLALENVYVIGPSLMKTGSAGNEFPTPNFLFCQLHCANERERMESDSSENGEFSEDEIVGHEV